MTVMITVYGSWPQIAPHIQNKAPMIPYMYTDRSSYMFCVTAGVTYDLCSTSLLSVLASHRLSDVLICLSTHRAQLAMLNQELESKWTVRFDPSPKH